MIKNICKNDKLLPKTYTKIISICKIILNKEYITFNDFNKVKKYLVIIYMKIIYHLDKLIQNIILILG